MLNVGVFFSSVECSEIVEIIFQARDTVPIDGTFGGPLFGLSGAIWILIPAIEPSAIAGPRPPLASGVISITEHPIPLWERPG